MTSTQIVVLVVILLAVIGAVAIAFIMRQRTEKLRAQFGPEYDRTVAETGNRFKAEARLAKVEERVRRYELRPIAAADRDRFRQSWRAVQAKFVDDPSRALDEADQLLARAMQARGYPPTDFQNRAMEISVDHGAVVENYRAGHEIVVRNARREATTEDLRKAMVHYRALFDELMQEEPVPLRARAVGRT
ncbi:MAG: hypothetical protein WCA15_09410 [Candidatus Acidiferrales bacterium]